MRPLLYGNTMLAFRCCDTFPLWPLSVSLLALMRRLAWHHFPTLAAIDHSPIFKCYAIIQRSEKLVFKRSSADTREWDILFHTRQNSRRACNAEVQLHKVLHLSGIVRRVQSKKNCSNGKMDITSLQTHLRYPPTSTSKLATTGMKQTRNKQKKKWGARNVRCGNSTAEGGIRCQEWEEGDCSDCSRSYFFWTAWRQKNKKKTRIIINMAF